MNKENKNMEEKETSSMKALEKLLYYANLHFRTENEHKTEFSDIINKIGISENEENFKIIEKDLKALKALEELKKENAKLKKVIDFLKLNFDISLDSKLRISDESECVQTFVAYLPENTTIDEMFEALREVLVNDKRV